jgi:glycerol uptake facilitator-like aquaporin
LPFFLFAIITLNLLITCSLIQSNVATAMLWEFIMTFTLVFVLFAVNYHKAAGDKESQLKGTAPIALGLCLIVATFAGGPFTGASLNPARSIAPAFVFGHWSALWAYLIATFGGGIAGGYAYENLFIEADEKAVAGTDYSTVGGSATLASA